MKKLIEIYIKKINKDKTLLSDKFGDVSYDSSIVLKILNSLQQSYESKIKQIENEIIDTSNAAQTMIDNLPASEGLVKAVNEYNAIIQGIKIGKQILEGEKMSKKEQK